MVFRDNIERAKSFAVLGAEAVRGIQGIDAEFFGFNDEVIFGAGTAEPPAIAALEAGGGNNDAAALWHAAQRALASWRSARVRVMISDDLPTECSAEALRSLVDDLTRLRRIACAQVAVEPLEEVCFPHYVEVVEEDFSAAVRRFGEEISRLVG